MRKRKSHPYLMRGQPKVTEPRTTVEDPPDRRVPEVPRRMLTTAQLRIFQGQSAIHPLLRPVDRCFERWAATPANDQGGPRIASIVIIGREATAAAPLDDAESKIVDCAIRASPLWASRFVQLWYRSELSVPAIADELKIKRRQGIYEERERVLFYYLGRLHEIGFGLIPRAPEV